MSDKLQAVYQALRDLHDAGIGASLYRMYGERMEVFIALPGIRAEEIGNNGHQLDTNPVTDRGIQNQETGK